MQRRAEQGSLTSKEKSRDDYYRSSRDNSNDRDRDRRQRKRERSRSNERRTRRSRSRENKTRPDKADATDQTDTRVREMSISPQHDEERLPTPPPPPKIGKISIGFNKPPPKPQPIKMTLGGGPAPNSTPVLKPKLTSVFNDGSDDEPEEMPAEARMRMRNIGRETPTSAGPNSFGKTKHGFCNAKYVFQRNLDEAMEKVSPPVNPTPKFPNTIYKFHQ